MEAKHLQNVLNNPRRLILKQIEHVFLQCFISMNMIYQNNAIIY